MKGTRKMPQCGFSRYVVVLLNAYGVKQYKDVNVLADDSIRQTIKEYSNWPTIPQVYIKGEFVGGCDTNYVRKYSTLWKSNVITLFSFFRCLDTSRVMVFGI